nr:MAG TPA: hypothetical protein [Caudoviricetes sp.]
MTDRNSRTVLTNSDARSGRGPRPDRQGTAARIRWVAAIGKRAPRRKINHCVIHKKQPTHTQSNENPRPGASRFALSGAMA